jgi:hypothetical protein
MRRPRAIIAICFLLVWSVAVDAHRLLYVLRMVSRGDGMSGWFDVATAGLLLAALLAALPALAGLWTLRAWGATAFGVWAVLAALQTGLVLFLIAALGGVVRIGWLAVGGLWLASIGILLGLWLYIRGVIPRTPKPPIQ